MTQTSTPADRTIEKVARDQYMVLAAGGEQIGTLDYSAACWWARDMKGDAIGGGQNTAQEAAALLPIPEDSTIVKAMTAKREATNRFIAADAELEVEDESQVKIEFSDDNPSRVATVLLSAYGAANLLDQLAAAAGYDLVRKTS